MKEQEVKDADDDIRLDRWFKRHFPSVTHGLLEKSLRKGMVRVDGKKATASTRVNAGQTIRFPEEWASIARAPKRKHVVSETDAKAMLRIVIYKDEHMLVVNKPPGLAVQGGTNQSKSLDDMLDALRFGHEERPRLVHRLDKDTSGCLVLARSAKAAHALAKQFAAKDARKIYVALVKGMPMPLKGTIELPLSKAEGNYEKMDVDDDGKPAVTEYEVLEHLSDKLSWVELSPITGRTHQLRVHMAAIGHPIIGDGKYGGQDAYVRGSLEVSTKLHLHAQRIRIRCFGKDIDVKAPLPPHMRESLQSLGLS